MSATLVSSNTTIKINAGINGTATVSQTLYTAPSNGYAIINLYTLTSAGTTRAFVAGRLVAESGADTFSFGIYVGPGQALSCTIGTGQVDFSGVEFVNTP